MKYSNLFAILCQYYNFHINANKADWLFIVMLQHQLIAYPEHFNLGPAGFSLTNPPKLNKKNTHTHIQKSLSFLLSLADALTTPSQRVLLNMPRLESQKYHSCPTHTVPCCSLIPLIPSTSQLKPLRCHSTLGCRGLSLWSWIRQIPVVL